MLLKGYISPSKRAKIKVFFILFGFSACGILVPWLGIKPMPPAGEVWSPNQWSESHSVMSDSLSFHGLYSPWNSPGQNAGVGNLSLLQRIFPTEGSNPGLLHCRQILYHLRHKGSPRILEWVAYPFSRGSSWPGSPTLLVDSLPTGNPQDFLLWP